jgi:hypothetical protein
MQRKINSGNKSKGGKSITDTTSGEVTSDAKEVLKIRKEHYMVLSTEDTGEREFIIENSRSSNAKIEVNLNHSIEWEEIINVLKRLKKYKAAGIDGVPVEVYKLVESEVTPTSNLAALICSTIYDCYESAIIPDIWDESSLIPIYKKGSESYCNNYRGIALINTMRKILCKVIADRLQFLVKEYDLITAEQIGFRSLEECVCHATSLLEICQRRKFKGLDSVLCFINLEKAYDKVQHGDC